MNSRARLAGRHQTAPAQLDRAERRRGSEVSGFRFRSSGGEPETITVFTTRPDTLFGATYMVLAPEHPLVAEITTAEQQAAVAAYQQQAASKSDLERRTWPRTRPASSPAPSRSTRSTAKRIPIWIADYVLMGYGTGAIMAVPAHDERDFEFAQAVRPADSRGGCAAGGTRPFAPTAGQQAEATRQRAGSSRFAQAGSRSCAFIGRAREFRLPRRPADRGSESEDHGWLEDRASAKERSITNCATGFSPPALLGRAISRSSGKTAGIARCPRAELPVLPPDSKISSRPARASRR